MPKCPDRPVLSPEQRSSWRLHGWLVLRGALDAETISAIDEAVTEVESWAGSPGLAHFEATPSGNRIARSEDFEPHHEVLSSFIRHGLISVVLEELLGEPAVLFKEKVNYKHAGGGGFAPHQDGTAYPHVTDPISVMVPLDEANQANGCLWFTDEHPGGELPNASGRIDEAWCERAHWLPVEVAPGDLVIFDAWAPHRSDSNHSSKPRRAMYLTYNRRSEGDRRDAYYRDKRAALAAAGGVGASGHVLISYNDDFLGTPVATPTSGSTQ